MIDDGLQGVWIVAAQVIIAFVGEINGFRIYTAKAN